MRLFMYLWRALGVLLLVGWYPTLWAQRLPTTRTLQGYVQDARTGEKLVGASVYASHQRVGATTNRFGFFSLAVDRKTTLVVSFVGYQPIRTELVLSRDTLITFALRADTSALAEVTVRTPAGKDTYQDAGMGRFLVPLDVVRKAPALLGENDLIKTLQLLPGVQAGTEGTVGLNVRGGSPDQNLVLLDGMTLYNVNHLFGFLSVINTDAVAQAEFLLGSIPARYGGRLASVLDVSLREGNLHEWKGTFGLSPIAGRLTLEGPLKKGVSSVLISARRTWLDALYWLGAQVSGNDNRTGYGFYDLNGKLNYKVSDRDRLYLSVYTGNDRFSNRLSLKGAQYKNQFAWGNQTLGFRWNHVYGNKLFSNTTLSYTNFEYGLREEYKAQKYYVNQVASGIRDLALKTDFDLYASPRHTVKFGAGVIAHRFQPEIKQYAALGADTTYQPTLPVQTREWVVYGEDDWTLSERWRANVGVHYASQAVGQTSYHALQPRLSVRYRLGEQAAFKASYNRMAQFLHLLTNSSVGLPTDLWAPVTDRLPPEEADSWALGYSRSLGTRWNLSLETYYKRMRNVLDYKEGTSFQNNFSTPWYERVSRGTGTAYGAEFYAEKQTGRTKGWLSYTLSWSQRQFTDINRGERFPYKYDRRHNIALVISHELSPRKSLSANLVYSSGTALTVAGSRYGGVMPGSDVLNQATVNPYTYQELQFFDNLPDLSRRNNFRTPAYHRLDVSYRTSKRKAHGERTWLFAVYNAYNRLNPFFLYYDQTQLKQFSLFPLIPSITYQYAF